MSVEVPGPRARVMSGLVALEQSVNAELPAGSTPLTVYRVRPAGLPDLPAVWNWEHSPSAAKLLDQANQRNTFNVSAYVGVEHSDGEEQMAAIDFYGDAVCEVFDKDFLRSPFLGGAADIADRVGDLLWIEPFGNTNVLCLEIPLRLLTHRIYPPS